ncbi:MAG: hypothetical protein ACTSPI_13310 [Candidatus Heimdallarchaeaceae archaeon]
MAMSLLRKQDYSIYYWLDDLFSSYDFVTIVDDYPDEDLSLPTISVVGSELYITPFELGNRSGNKNRIYFIDVYAENKDQRDDFSYLILEEIENGIPVNNYDEGFPPTTTPSQIGTLHPIDLRLEPVFVFPELTEKLYWRTRISFISEYYSSS